MNRCHYCPAGEAHLHQPGTDCCVIQVGSRSIQLSRAQSRTLRHPHVTLEGWDALGRPVYRRTWPRVASRRCWALTRAGDPVPPHLPVTVSAS
jgi:hypothetical protein